MGKICADLCGGLLRSLLAAPSLSEPVAFASFNELRRVSLASIITSAFHTVAITIAIQRMPISYYIIGAVIQFVAVLFIRFAYRYILLERSKRTRQQQKTAASRVMLIGAGVAGQMILRDLHSAKEVNERVCCIIDDNKNKWGRYIDGVPIVGGRDDILVNVQKYNIRKDFPCHTQRRCGAKTGYS